MVLAKLNHAVPVPDSPIPWQKLKGHESNPNGITDRARHSQGTIPVFYGWVRHLGAKEVEIMTEEHFPHGVK
jgi:hypothetical protein